MHNYTNLHSNEDNKHWSSFIQHSNNGTYNDFNFNSPLYSSIFPTTGSLPIVVDYKRRNSPDFAPFQDLIDRRNWCLSNLRLSTKEAETLRQENVNLQRVNCELNKQLSQVQLQAANSNTTPFGNSIVKCHGRMRNGEKGMTVSEQRAVVARGVENVDPVKKTDVDRVKLPKSISVRSNGYLKSTVQGGDFSTGIRARAVDRVKPASDMVSSKSCLVS